MTHTLYIADDDGSTPFDFLSGYITLSLDTYQDDGNSLSFVMVGQGLTKSLMTEFNQLEALLKLAALYAPDGLRSNAVWLYHQTNEDVLLKRRVILSYTKPTFVSSTGGGINPFLTSQTIKFSFTVFVGSPDWEDSDETPVTSTTLDALGGVYNFQTTQQGTAYGRIKSIRLDTLNQPGLITRLWMGIRPKRDGLTDFVNVWRCSLGDNGSGTTGTSDTQCASGTRKTVTYSASALTRRTTIQYDDINGSLDSTHLRGTYLVLLRYKILAASTAWEVQVRYGYSGGTHTPLEPQVISTSGGSDSNYRVLEMGTVQFPPSADRGLITNFDECELSIYAGGISGSGNLGLGELILIPTNHLIRVSGASIGPSTGNFETTIYTHPDMTVYGYGYDTNPNAAVAVSAENWFCPFEPCALYIAAAQDEYLTLDDTIDISMVLHRKYESYAI